MTTDAERAQDDATREATRVLRHHGVELHPDDARGLVQVILAFAAECAPAALPSEDRAREVLASVVPPSWREGILSGKNSDWGHIRPSEAIRAMLAFAAQPQPEVEIPEYPAGGISHLEGLAVLLDGYSRHYVANAPRRLRVPSPTMATARQTVTGYVLSLQLGARA